MQRTFFLATLVAAAIALLPTMGIQAETITMQRMEMIQRSEVVFVGRVTEKNARWNERGNLIFTDYTVVVQQVLKGQIVEESIVLSFAGGQIGNTGHSVSGVPELNVGEVSLLMVPDLKLPRMSPLTGSFQGHYSAVTVAGRNAPVTFNGFNRAELIDGEPVEFSEFIALVKAEIVESVSVPPVNRDPLETSLPFVLKDLPSVPYARDEELNGGPSFLPVEKPSDDSQSPTPPNHRKPAVATESDQIILSPPRPRWTYENRARDVPIVFNPWADSFSRSPHDQFAMSYWNKYNNIFQVSTATGTWAWENGRYDMAGFETNETMIAQFGAGWGDSTLAVAWKRWNVDDGLSFESDIAFNPAYSWTTNDFVTYFDSNVFNLDRTLTHEIGHAWGLEHQFEALSVMNYAPHKYRAYNVIYRDDVAGVRAAFPNTATSVTDLGISLFYNDGFQDYDDSTIDKTLVAASDSLTVTDFVIHNSGTVTATPDIDWYLTPSIHSWTGAVSIGSTTHSSLDPDNGFRTTRTLSIPSGISDGTYYLACFVANSDDTISDNNSSWLDRAIVVDNAPPAPTNDNWIGDSISDFAAGTNVSATVQANEPNLSPAGATVWWYYLPAEDGVLTVDTFGSDFDTMLHVYSGVTSGFGEWTLEADDDDTDDDPTDNTRQSKVSFPVEGGVFYDIRVAGYSSASGQIELNVEFEPSPILLGDVNQDGEVNFSDISSFISLLSSGTYQAEADFDENGIVDFQDISPFIGALSGQ